MKLITILLSFFVFTLICSGCEKETSVEQSAENRETDLKSDTMNVGNTDNEETHTQERHFKNIPDKSNADKEMPLSIIGAVNSIDIEICGQQFAFPCRFGEFGENFKLENGYYFEEQDYTLYHLWYQNEDICTIYLAGEKKDDNSETMVVGIDKRDLETNQFLIDGLGYDSQDTYIEHFGEPSVQKEGYLEYVSENTVLSIFLDNEEIDFPESIVLLFTDYRN